MAVVKWVDGYKFAGTCDSGHSLVLDAAEEAGGKDEGARPLELLLVALGACSGMDVISILQKQSQIVRSFEIRVSGTRREDYPKYYTKIQVEYALTGHNLDQAKAKRAVELSEQKYCSVYAMLVVKATITSSIQLMEG